MTTKPDCGCWHTPEKAAERERLIDGVAYGIQMSIEQVAHDLDLCPFGIAYLGGAVIAAIEVLVARHYRDDDEKPTPEQLTAVEEKLLVYSRERIAGARLKDMDAIQPATESRH